jgi:hypothetical protein
MSWSARNGWRCATANVIFNRAVARELHPASEEVCEHAGTVGGR